ncbi:hypothetical protein AB4Z46_30720 [Variovorax sp. M-6]|uniref:hypothetical protein n=1 Tax=Variovorax sp. M-6 TaxID=3233041 RepID=UPI003F97A26C
MNGERPFAQSRSLARLARARRLSAMLDVDVPRAAAFAGAAPRDAFIATRSPFDVFAELAKVVRAAKREVLIVDPYVNATALTDIAIAAQEGVRILILGDRAGSKSSLAPAASRWQAQYRSARPLEVRLARDRSLHDRLLLIDRTEVWNLSQSIADFAKKSPASIERSGAAIEKEKAVAYLGLWIGATPLA